MATDDAFFAFLSGLEDSIDHVYDEPDPVIDFGVEETLPMRMPIRTSAMGQVVSEPLAYLSGIRSTTGETADMVSTLQDISGLFLVYN